MFIAHLPAGYLLSQAVPPRLRGWVLAGSILPDADLIVVYGLGVAAHHHGFLTHRPALWLSVLMVALLLRRWPLATIGLGGMLHVTLDSWAGRIDWGWPFATLPVTVMDVPARFEWWGWNFLLHPSFLIEPVIVGAAVVVWIRTIKKKPLRD
ncbi:MAG: metal-dependent hydrolase [Pseudomonadota bacterium]